VERLWSLRVCPAQPLYARTASDVLFQRDIRTGKKLTFMEKAVTRPLEQVVPISWGP